MEYLVTMTTHVPDGTSQQAVDAVRTREAARSGELAEQGHLLRLWRPPLQPGQWRTLGLFAADNDGQLEALLASMPLRVWRTDEVTQLLPHPNDSALPGADSMPGSHGNSHQAEKAAEFLTTFTIAVPAGTSAQAVAETEASEARRTQELTRQGRLLRLWNLPSEPGQRRALGLWRTRDAAEMQAILASLPMDAWMTVETTPLTQHPSDPAFNTS
jgi:muconolactone delta-isomerase